MCSQEGKPVHFNFSELYEQKYLTLNAVLYICQIEALEKHYVVCSLTVALKGTF